MNEKLGIKNGMREILYSSCFSHEIMRSQEIRFIIEDLYRKTRLILTDCALCFYISNIIFAHRFIDRCNLFFFLYSIGNEI